MKRYEEILPGFGLTLTIAMISYMTSSLHETFDPLVISIIFGLLVGNMFDDRKVIQEGVNTSLKIFLPIGIGLYGAQLSFSGVEVRFFPIGGVFLLAFAVTYFVSRGFGISKVLAFLLSSGISICGASAIIVIAPILYAEREDTSVSILSVMTVGLTGMLFYRFIPDLMGLPLDRYAFLSGMTLPMFGQVKVAAKSMGAESLELASNFKLFKMSALLPVALLAMVVRGSKIRKISIPWFMVVFFAIAMITNMFEKAAFLREMTKPVSSFCLSATLSAIGLSLEFDSITERGITPLFASFLSWGIVVLTIYLLFNVVV